ncbi:HAUS augmin-like complex subunit 5 [Lissotriton helveticus]
MGLSPQHVPSVSASKKLCVRQCADIWRFVISHVRSHKNAKIIKGNVLCFALQESADSHKEKYTILKEISELKSKLQHDDMKLKRQLPELTASLSTMESSYEKLRDVQRRSLLLTAYLRKKERERAKVEETNSRIERHICAFEEIERKSNVKINLDLAQSESILTGASLPALEPTVLRDVKKATLMRYEFLKSLAHDSISDSVRAADKEEQRQASHQQWLSMVENVLTSHPANHILSALEHLAQQNSQNLKQLTASTDIHSEIEGLKFRFGKSHLEDVSEARNMLPSVQVLMQEGWGECEELWVQQIPLRTRVKHRFDRLTAFVKEFFQRLSENSDLSEEKCQLDREAFDLELKHVLLKAFLDTLLKQCRALEDENSKKTKQKCALKEKQLQIKQFRKLVARKQEQIQILIAGNSCSKAELKKSQVEVQQFLQMKVVLPVNEMKPEVSVLYGAVDQEVQQFRNINLSSLQRVTLDELHRVPIRELSIYRLDSPQAPGVYNLREVCQIVRFPPYKAADKMFMHLSDLKAEQMRLQQQVMYCTEKVDNLKQQILAQQPEAQVLIQRIKEQNDEQIRELVPQVQRITEEYRGNLEQAREVERAIYDWWVQPAQFALPDEKRFGLNMRDWYDRWLVAMKNTGLRS